MVAKRQSTEQFLAGDGVMFDVRSPAEYQQGRIPGSINLPLFTDAERGEIGTVYAKQGNVSAVLRGLERVGPRLADMASTALRTCATVHPGSQVRIHCARGGMRSSSVAWLLGTVGMQCTVAEGGYKAFRGWTAKIFSTPRRMAVLGGRTGSGKTRMLAALAAAGHAVLDLEGIAQHKGSAFGGLQGIQPSNEQFENEVACVLWKEQRSEAGERLLWVEDESRAIGRCYVPEGLMDVMRRAPLIAVRVPDAVRFDYLMKDYANAPIEALVEATERLTKRFGPLRTAEAVKQLRAGDKLSAAAVLLEYYDRAYAHSMSRSRKGFIALKALDTWDAAQWASVLPQLAEAYEMLTVSSRLHGHLEREEQKEEEEARDVENCLRSMQRAWTGATARLVITTANGAAHGIDIGASTLV